MHRTTMTTRRTSEIQTTTKIIVTEQPTETQTRRKWRKTNSRPIDTAEMFDTFRERCGRARIAKVHIKWVAGDENDITP